MVDSRVFKLAEKLPKVEDIMYRGHLINVKTNKLEDNIDVIVEKCIVIEVSRKTNIVYMPYLEADDTCVFPIIEKGHGLGTFLLDFVIYYCRDIIKVDGIKLKDHAYFNCGNARINLATHYLLLYHKTWYEKFGFQPKKLEKYKQDKAKTFIELADLNPNLRKDLIQVSGLLPIDTVSSALRLIYKTDCNMYASLLNRVALDIKLIQYDNENLGQNYGCWKLFF